VNPFAMRFTGPAASGVVAAVSTSRTRADTASAIAPRLLDASGFDAS